MLKWWHRVWSVLPFHQCGMFPAEILNLCHHSGVVSVALDEPLILRLWDSQRRFRFSRSLHFTCLPFLPGFDVTGWCWVVLPNQVLNPSPVAGDPSVDLLSGVDCAHRAHYWAPLYIGAEEMSGLERSRSHHWSLRGSTHLSNHWDFLLSGLSLFILLLAVIQNISNGIKSQMFRQTMLRKYSVRAQHLE